MIFDIFGVLVTIYLVIVVLSSGLKKMFQLRGLIYLFLIWICYFHSYWVFLCIFLFSTIFFEIKLPIIRRKNRNFDIGVRRADAKKKEMITRKEIKKGYDIRMEQIFKKNKKF